MNRYRVSLRMTVDVEVETRIALDELEASDVVDLCDTDAAFRNADVEITDAFQMERVDV